MLLLFMEGQYMDLGNTIKHYRTIRNLTQKQLGDLLGVAEITIRQYETNKREPKISQLKKIASVLNVPISTLIGGLTDEQHIKSVLELIQDNDKKRKELIIEILKTHNYNIKEKNRLLLTITDHQGFSFLTSRDSFDAMIERSDRDICYNIEKLICESQQITKNKQDPDTPDQTPPPALSKPDT